MRGAGALWCSPCGSDARVARAPPAVARAGPARRSRRGARRAIDLRAPAAGAVCRAPPPSSRFHPRDAASVEDRHWARRPPTECVPASRQGRSADGPDPSATARAREPTRARHRREAALSLPVRVRRRGACTSRASSGGSRRTHNCPRAARSDTAGCDRGVRGTLGAESRTDPTAGPAAVRRSESRRCERTRTDEAPRRALRAGPASRLRVRPTGRGARCDRLARRPSAGVRARAASDRSRSR